MPPEPRREVLQTPLAVHGGLDFAELRRLGKLQLVPGMPAEVFLEAGSRTMLSYLFKPVTDQLSRMFRER